MRIIVDVMGGDNAPYEIIKGAIEAAGEFGTEIILTGRGEEILRIIEKLGLGELPRGIEIANASEVIEAEDDPAVSIRQKKDSSIVVGLGLLRDGRGDAFVSAGNTGAVLSGATLIVKRVRGIRRAALAPYVPSQGGGFVLIDCGANSDCTPEYLLQFAFMGSYYAQDVLEIAKPRVGLLNNGSERTKGTPLHIEAHSLLYKAGAENLINFVGNVEAKEAMLGACDVLVSDGFSGNVFLKTAEGSMLFVMSELKKLYTSSIITKLSALLITKHFDEIRGRLNPDKVGGTALLGISKPVIKAHGSSNSTAIKNAIRQAINCVSTNTAERLHSNIEHMRIYDSD